MEFAAQTCGLSVETLKQVAHMIAKADGVCILWAMGVTQHSMGSDASTAISNLLLVTGNYMRTRYRCLPSARPQQRPGRERSRGHAKFSSGLPVGG